MKVLHVIAAFEVGGAERTLLTLVEGSRARGIEVAIVAPAGRMDAELDAAVRRFHFADRGRSAAGVAAAALRVAAATRRFAPDVVHGHNVKATAMAALGARLARPLRPPPVVATFHGVVPGEYLAAARWLKRTAGTVVCVSEEVRRSLEAAGLAASRSRVVRNGVPEIAPLTTGGRQALDDELGLTGAPVVAIVGRLVAVKAHHRFLDAAAVIARSVPAARFLVVGGGPMRGELEQQARQLGIADRVRFTGMRDDARALLARADVLLMTSESEGLSVAVIEALAAGVPVVSTPALGMRELLGQGGGVVVPGGGAEDLAAEVVRLLGSAERRRAMGDEGRRSASERYSAERMIDEYVALWTGAVGA